MSTANETVRVSDMEYLSSALNHAASPIVINIASLAASKGAVVKSTEGRVKVIAKRYGLEITTTMKGEVNGSAVAATPVEKRKGAVGKANGKTENSKRSEEEGVGSGNEDAVDGKGTEMDEDAPPSKKAKPTNVKTEQDDDPGASEEDDGGANDGGDAEEELA